MREVFYLVVEKKLCAAPEKSFRNLNINVVRQGIWNDEREENDIINNTLKGGTFMGFG